MIRRTLTTAALALTLVSAPSGSAHARSVSYSDRHTDSSFIATLSPGQGMHVSDACGKRGSFTEYHAYRANGSALGEQRYNVANTVSWWSVPGTRSHARVTYRRGTFRNRTSVRVMVAAWCGDERLPVPTETD